MTRTAHLPTAAALITCLTLPVAAETLLVTNAYTGGEGSLQAALDLAGASSEPSTIIVTFSDGSLETPGGLTYFSTSPLSIYGNGLIVMSSQNVTLFSAVGTPELALSDMTFRGNGGWSIENRGDTDGPAGKGIFLDVADDATGQVTLTLTDIFVEDVAGHGIHVSDCSLADDCGGGGGGAGEGSDASILVEVTNLTIESVGNGSFDADGLRVDERGPGDITLLGTLLFATAVGADGVDLDEGQNGNVHINLQHGYFGENGGYCAPALLASFMPEVPEDDFAEGAVASNAIPGPITGSPDDRCFERDVSLYDDGSVEDYEFTIDVDDGFDVDEAGEGSIFASIVTGAMIGSRDEGYDFDEEGPGNIDVVFAGISAAGNVNDALKLSEAGAGDVFVTITASEATMNGGAGIVVQEDGPGDLTMVLVSSATAGNDGGDLGIEVEQDDGGTGEVYVIDSEIADGIETDGAVLDAD